MPNSYVKSLAKKTGRSVEEIDRLWNKAKEIAVTKYGNNENIYGIIVGILKKMLKIAKKEGLLEDPNILIEDYLNGDRLNEKAWRMRAEPKSDASIIFKGDSFKARQNKRDSERKKKQLKAQKQDSDDSKLEMTEELELNELLNIRKD